MLSIHLHNLQFFANHGIHQEEKIWGNQFEVNVTVQYLPLSSPIIHLKDTIDYVAIFSLIKTRMNNPTNLLETLATEIAEAILAQFLQAELVTISIKKIRAPVIGLQGGVGVSLTLNRNNLK